MMFSAAVLRETLAHLLPVDATGWVVGLSGGADSAALLLAATQLARGAGPVPLRALHVNHGLQAAAGQFVEGCVRLCEHLAVPLTVVAVTVPEVGDSLEAAARAARQAAFAAELRPGECLLTAHHRDDQAETVLLQLLRGAGLKGLAAMPASRVCGGGWHLRPLLEVSRAQLTEFVQRAGLAVLEDPMNDDQRFDRVYLRAKVLPQVARRWPSYATVLARGARHLAEAQCLLDDAAAGALRRLRDGDAISVTGLRALPHLERINLVRHWILAAGHEAPPSARLNEALRQAVDADAGRQPAICWGTQTLRRYRDRLFLVAGEPPRIGVECMWRVARDARLDLGVGLGQLRWVERVGGLDATRLPAALQVRRRLGGESLKPGRGATQTLQHLCQAHGVLPWMRDALPLLFAGTVLVAVGDLWRDSRWCVPADALGLDCEWADAPILV